MHYAAFVVGGESSFQITRQTNVAFLRVGGTLEQIDIVHDGSSNQPSFALRATAGILLQVVGLPAEALAKDGGGGSCAILSHSF